MGNLYLEGHVIWGTITLKRIQYKLQGITLWATVWNGFFTRFLNRPST